LLPLGLAMLAGAILWYAHAQAWDLGGRSPILSYDSAQYALAARELVWHGRLATPYALPLDLASHAGSPWPLSALQPGLVLAEALIFKLAPFHGVPVGSDPRAWLTLILPFMSYLMLGAGGVLGMRHLLARYAPDSPPLWRMGAPAAVGFLLLLDPEAQHFAVTGLTELPFTVLLLAALLGLARGAGELYPLAFGLVLGLAGLFRANMLWLAPLFALASAWCAPPGKRVRVALGILAGFALPLLPWWSYKWRAFGSPTWDITRFVVWDQVEGRTWFQLYHRPAPPDIPAGIEAVRLLAAKTWGNLGKLLPVLLEGPRGLWFGALVAYLFTRPRRPLAASAVVALAALALNTLAACASIPWLRFLFPTRVLAEAAGLVAVWSLVQRIPQSGERLRQGICVAAAVLALAWGGWLTQRAQAEAHETSRERGVPQSRTLTALSIALNETLRPSETVMSNLGPALAWQTNHPVIHLAYSPADVPACRTRHEFRHLVLVFRDAERAWPFWQEIVEHYGTASTIPGLNVTRERRFRTVDGFVVVWLELGPNTEALANARP
jgi:hypothetical protein